MTAMKIIAAVVSGIWLWVPLMFVWPLHFAFALGFSVEPGGLLIQHIRPGDVYDLAKRGGVGLRIHNKTERAQAYGITVGKPTEMGLRRWTAGYLPMPDPEWVSVVPETVTVPPREKGDTGIFIRVPEGEAHFNQHWVVVLQVASRPGPGEAVSLALKPVYYLETSSRRNITGWAKGDIGIAPAILALQGKESASIGEKNRMMSAKFQIHNGGARSYEFRISRHNPEVSAGGQRISPTPGFSWLAEDREVWVLPERLRLKAGETREISVKCAVPHGGPFRRQRQEVLLWIMSPTGSLRSRFLRIQLR
jgi:hypothetical protein